MVLQRASRRRFLADVGCGMLAAGVGAATASNLGLTKSLAADSADEATRLRFGARDRLVDLIQTTAESQILPAIVKELRSGTPLPDLIAATALANARAFGGEDYIGFHTFMALAPALTMTRELPAEQRALPVMKVLYRNASRLRAAGLSSDTLKAVTPSGTRSEQASALQIRDAVHKLDLPTAEQAFASACQSSATDGWNALLETVEESTEVHRVVLAHRAWDMLELVGPEHAQTMLRQSLHYCWKSEGPRVKHHNDVPSLLTKLMEQYKLLGIGSRATRSADNAWLESFSQTIFKSTAHQAAEAVAAALADGFPAQSVSDAVSLAANQLLLRDSGRIAAWAQPNKPIGSVHGDSIGVHASDAVNAWRHIATVSNARNSAAALILSGYEVARDRESSGLNFLEWQPRPDEKLLSQVKGTTQAALLSELDGVIREKNQDMACAVTHAYRARGFESNAVFSLCLKYALSEDGALHAEKFYRTSRDEYARLPVEFRDRLLVGLARVTASAYGYEAPGYKEAVELLKS